MRTLIVCCIAFSLNSSIAIAQSQERMYALMLIHFAKGIYWPETHTQDFVIGVFEYAPLISDLTATSSNINIHGRKIKVVEIFSLDEARKCQIIFVPAYKAKALEELVELVIDRPTLIITNKIDQVKKGSSIDLVLRKGKLTFDIDCKGIEAKGMKISANIRSTGNPVQ